MANEITGRIVRIGETAQIPSKDGQRTFSRRELTLAEFRFDSRTGERTESDNKPTVEFGGEICRELDKYAVGQAVTVAFDPQGTSYTDRQGETKWFTKANGYRIRLRPDLMGMQQTAATGYAQVQPQAAPQPQQPQSAETAASTQEQTRQQQPAPQQQEMFNSQEQGTEDNLPF